MNNRESKSKYLAISIFASSLAFVSMTIFILVFVKQGSEPRYYDFILIVYLLTFLTVILGTLLNLVKFLKSNPDDDSISRDDIQRNRLFEHIISKYVKSTDMIESLSHLNDKFTQIKLDFSKKMDEVEKSLDTTERLVKIKEIEKDLISLKNLLMEENSISNALKNLESINK